MPTPLEVKVLALQCIIEVMLATRFGVGRADECEADGKRIANHARLTAANLAAGFGPIEVEAVGEQIDAIAKEVERIHRNAASRIRTAPTPQNPL